MWRIGRPYYIARSSLNSLALLETLPDDRTVYTGSNSLNWWTRSQRIRTAAEVPFETILADTATAPVYQQIAAKAVHLKQLGLGSRAIARGLGVRREMVLKALAWISQPQRSE